MNFEALSKLSDHELNRMLLAGFGLNPDFAIIPDYTTNLNETRFAEGWLEPHQQAHYTQFLVAICGGSDCIWNVAHASPKQRTIALLLTLSLTNDKHDQRIESLYRGSR